jgi:hypothetical protein
MQLHDIIEKITISGEFKPMNSTTQDFEVLAYSRFSAKVTYKNSLYYAYLSSSSIGLPCLTIESWGDNV